MSETGCLWAYDMPGNSSPAKEVTNNIKLSLIVSESIKQISMSVSLIRSFRTHRAYAVSTGRVMNSYRKNKYIFSNSPPHHFFATKSIIRALQCKIGMPPPRSLATMLLVCRFTCNSVLCVIRDQFYSGQKLVTNWIVKTCFRIGFTRLF